MLQERTASRTAESIPGTESLRPWQFFVLAALACATAVTFIVRGQGVTAVLLLALLMGAAALVGMAVLRTVQPLVGRHDDRTAMIGQRTRAALEREKMLALRAIKELEFDKAMGKVSEDDFRDMSGRLRARAGRLMRQLDAGGGYREQVERDLVKRLAGGNMTVAGGNVTVKSAVSCATCATVNDTDARFCKGCGGKL
jgi:hypothetical protein